MFSQFKTLKKKKKSIRIAYHQYIGQDFSFFIKACTYNMTSWFESTNLIEFAYERPEQRNFTSNIIRICSYDCSLFAVPPVIKEKEQVTNVSVLVNQLTNLFCEVEGTPSPIITWYKDDVQVSGDIQIFLISCL